MAKTKASKPAGGQKAPAVAVPPASPPPAQGSQPVTVAQPAKMGRPRKPPPADAVARITAMAADGFSMRGIAYSLDSAFETLQHWFDDYPELKEAYEMGRENERHALHNKLYRLAMDQDDKVCAMFLLKARHGYREGDQGETANRVTINFSMPGAMPLATFMTATDEPAT